MAIEEPRYQVVEQDGAFELRDYAAYLVAETRVEASFTDAGNEAFRRLFRYISGNNAAQQKMAMTAPVTQGKGEKIAMTAPVTQVADADGYRVAFVVPSRYSASTVPEPLDPRIEIRAVPARRVAVWRYSGRWTQERYDQMERQLREAIAARGLSVDGPPVLARYDPPFMPWFMRRNEVLIPTAAPHPMRAAAGKG
jgi:effector-binding domain-containing protein